MFHCKAIRFVSFIALLAGLWLASGALYAAHAMPDDGLNVADNAQAATFLAGLLVILTGWTGLFCNHKAR